MRGCSFLTYILLCVLVHFFAAADVLLWKDKKTSAVVIGGATVIWILFEVLDYHLLTLLSHVMIGALAILFLWSKATTFIKKLVRYTMITICSDWYCFHVVHIQCSCFRSPPDIPVVQIPEDVAVNVSRALRSDINRALHLFREIALGHDLKKFLGVCFYPGRYKLFMVFLAPVVDCRLVNTVLVRFR